MWSVSLQELTLGRGFALSNAGVSWPTSLQRRPVRARNHTIDQVSSTASFNIITHDRIEEFWQFLAYNGAKQNKGSFPTSRALVSMSSVPSDDGSLARRIVHTN